MENFRPLARPDIGAGLAALVLYGTLAVAWLRHRAEIRRLRRLIADHCDPVLGTPKRQS